MNERSKNDPWKLTPRQRMCMDAMLAFDTYKRAAAAMGIAVKTVDNYLDAAKKQMGARDRKQALEMWRAYRRPPKRQRLSATLREQVNAALCFNLGRAIGRAA
jgi:DNA-binding CsgD family transcriptional regulator